MYLEPVSGTRLSHESSSRRQNPPAEASIPQSYWKRTNEVLAAASFGVGKFIMMKPPVFLASDKLPHFGEWFMVVTPLGHRLGFRGPAGEWRQVRDGSPLEGVQSWYPMDGEHPVETLPGHL